MKREDRRRSQMIRRQGGAERGAIPTFEFAMRLQSYRTLRSRFGDDGLVAMGIGVDAEVVSEGGKAADRAVPVQDDSALGQTDSRKQGLTGKDDRERCEHPLHRTLAPSVL